MTIRRMTERLRALTLSFALVACFAPCVGSAGIPTKVTVPTAQSLAEMAIGRLPWEYGLLDVYNMGSNQFFTFQGVREEENQASEDQASNTFGYFAVNKWTGDVWILWGCKKLSSPALLKAQEGIKRRFNRDEAKNYERLRNLEPECFYRGDMPTYLLNRGQAPKPDAR